MAHHLAEPAALVRRCVQLIEGYNAAVDTVDVYVVKALGPTPGPGETTRGVGVEDYTFLQQVLYGTERMDKALRIFLNALYHVNAAHVSRPDYTMYKVLAYLLFFRLRDLGSNKLLPLLDSQDPAKMHHLLALAMDREAMGHWVLEGWCRLLDRSFIEASILSVLDDARGVLEGWLDRTRGDAFGRGGGGGGGTTPLHPPLAAPGGGVATGASSTGGRGGGKAPTVPRAPNLTQPKPRLPREPLRIPQSVKANPVPPHLDAPGRALADIVAEREASRARASEETAAKYAAARPPALHETRRNVDRVREEVEAVREAAMVLPAELRYRPPPALPSHGADVAYTVAAVLREDAVARAKAGQEADLLRKYEEGLRDSTEFYAWQEEERRKDEASRLAAVSARKEECEAAAVKLQVALAAKVAGNRSVARAVKQAAAVAAEHLHVEREGLGRLHSRLAAQVKEREFVAPTLAKAAVVAAARLSAAEGRERREEAEGALAAARAQENAASTEVIRQIRALERVPRPHVRTYDPSAPSASSSHTLEAMSLVELRERLVLLKATDAEGTEERRRDILRAKREAQEVLMAKVEAMKARRGDAEARSKSARAEAKWDAAAAEAAREQAREASLLSLADKLEARKIARALDLATLAAAHARAGKEAAYRGGTVSAQEEVRLGQVLLAGERAAGGAQSKRLAEAREDEVAAARHVRDVHVRAALDEEGAAAEERGRALAVATASAEERRFRLASTAARKDAFFRQTVEEQALVDARDATNPYAGTVRAAEVSAARAHRGEAGSRASQQVTKLTRRIDRLPAGHALAPNMTLKLAQARVAAGAGGQ